MVWIVPITHIIHRDGHIARVRFVIVAHFLVRTRGDRYVVLAERRRGDGRHQRIGRGVSGPTPIPTHCVTGWRSRRANDLLFRLDDRGSHGIVGRQPVSQPKCGVGRFLTTQLRQTLCQRGIHLVLEVLLHLILAGQRLKLGCWTLKLTLVSSSYLWERRREPRAGHR